MGHDHLGVLDEAMMRLRRVWAPPPASEHAVVPDHGLAGEDPAGGHSSVELSTVLVVETCARAAAAGAEATVADVAAFAAVAPSTASRFVRRAADAGMVARTPAARDARRAAVGLTEAGWALHARARALRMRRLEAVVGDWAPGELATFAALLTRFAARATDPDRGAPFVPTTSRPSPGPDLEPAREPGPESAPDTVRDTVPKFISGP